MANFYPSMPSTQLPESERLVHRALRTLNDEWDIFPSFQWLPMAERTEGECDIVVWNPSLNLLLVIEAKPLCSVTDGVWTVRGGTHTADPFGQGRRAVHVLSHHLQRHGVIGTSSGAPHRPNDAYQHCGYGVWFTQGIPDFTSTAQLDKEICLSADDLTHPEKGLRRVASYWKSNTAANKMPISNLDRRKLRNAMVTNGKVHQTIMSILNPTLD